MRENHPLRVRSASPRVRLLGDHSRRGESPSVDPAFEAYRCDLERNMNQDPTSYPVHTLTLRVRNPERTITTETQQSLTNDHLEEYKRLCERLRGLESNLLAPTDFLREAKLILAIADYQIQHDTEDHIQSEEEASVREYLASHSRNPKEAMLLRGYLQVQKLDHILLLPILYSDHRMHIRESRYRANTLESLQSSLTDANSVESMRHEIALLRATADHAEFDGKLGDQHRTNLIAIHQKTIDEYSGCEDSKEVILRGINLEFDERVRYQRARDSSIRQRDAKLHVLYKRNLEAFRWVSFHDVTIANYLSGYTSRGNTANGPEEFVSHESRPLQFYYEYLQHWPNTTSASGSTPTSHPFAPGKLGVLSRLNLSSLSRFQHPLRYTGPPTSPDSSTFTGLSFSRAELEEEIRSNLASNMDLVPCSPAAACPPIAFQHPVDPSELHLPSPIRQQPPPSTPITAETYPNYRWNTPNSRNWIYQNLVTSYGYSELDAYNIVMGWVGGGMTLRRMSLFDWQVLTSSQEVGWYLFKRMSSVM